MLFSTYGRLLTLVSLVISAAPLTTAVPHTKRQYDRGTKYLLGVGKGDITGYVHPAVVMDREGVEDMS